VRSINKFWEFETARTFVVSLRLNSYREWREYCRSGKKCLFLPSCPEITYKNNGWISWNGLVRSGG
jgi:hypothetical protein